MIKIKVSFFKGKKNYLLEHQDSTQEAKSALRSAEQRGRHCRQCKKVLLHSSNIYPNDLAYLDHLYLNISGLKLIRKWPKSLRLKIWRTTNPGVVAGF